MPKLKHSFTNYLKIPLVFLLNPPVYLLIIIVEFVLNILNKVEEYLPKIDVDWSEENERLKEKILKGLL